MTDLSREALEAAEKRASNAEALCAKCRDELARQMQRATEAERAVAAMRREIETLPGRIHREDCGVPPKQPCTHGHVLDKIAPLLATLSTPPLGSGWLSPEQGAEKDARIVEVTAEIAGRDRALAWAREAITVLSAQVASLGGKLPEIILNPLAAHSTENR